MRIAVVNRSSRRVGGIESYLNSVIPELARAGHEVSFLCEVDEPGERDRIALPSGSSNWCVEDLGAEKALAALRDWQPEVIYTHRLESPDLEEETLKIGPAVFFAHDYYGTCISGTKTHRYPVIKPCERRFGPRCLAHYFPNRCGGLSPITMVKLYRLQSRRLELLHRYDAIVTHSDHMLKELINHGLSARSAYSFPYFVGRRHPDMAAIGPLSKSEDSALSGPISIAADLSPRTEKSHFQLLFSGRMELLKGGHVLLESLPEVQAGLPKPLRVVFAGDGRKRKAWELQAERLQRRHTGIDIEFVGWVDRAQMDLLLDESDLVVVPSLWPEPFGLVGLEAGLKGVPVAAFAVGGISDWLEDGVNGHLASGDPPTADGLAQAIIRCLRDPLAHARLRARATALAERFSIKNHMTVLLEVFQSVAKN